jgi:cellulose synthase (UDP-forming)
LAPAHTVERERVWLSLFAHVDEEPLPAEVSGRSEGALRIRFAPLSLEQERALVQALFCRADAWLSWTDGHLRDRPLRTLGSIAALGAKGLWKAMRLPGRPTPPRLAPARAAS